MPFEIPLFPLNVVLFPGMQLPLHIFEPRYRLMIDRCLEADLTFGVALLVNGVEGQPGTLPADVGCTAEITEAIRLADGRINLSTEGRRRFRVLSLREEDDYLIGTVEWLDDNPSEVDATEMAQQVRHALRRYLSRVMPDLDMEGLEWDMMDDPYALSTSVAALLVLPSAPEQELLEKQALLELTSTTARLKRELQLLYRIEVVQRAFEQRAHWPAPDTTLDESLAVFAKFLSLN
jgi:Lon protease-like protein